MSGFYCPTTLTPAPAEPAAAIITGDGWFPDVDPDAARDAMRIREGVTNARLRFALVGAILHVGDQLAAWAVTKVAAGHLHLADVPAPMIDGESRLVILYRRAVLATAKAELVEGYRDTDLTGAGQRKVDEVEPSIGELRRDAVHAIRDILGVPRVDVALI